jgi:hypothetical protein
MHRDITTAIAGLLSAAAASAQHETDIILKVEEGRIVTGGVTEEGDVEYPRRVYAAEFGVLPDFTDEPGFDSDPGAFAPGTLLGVDALRALHVWNGSDFWTIAEASLTVSKLGQDLVTPACDRLEPGILVGAAAGNGQFHHHVGFTLGAPASAGVYLLELHMWEQAGAIASSAPFWIVFNQDEREDVHDAAIEWVREHEFQLSCRGDLNDDGALNIFDFLAMQGLVSTGSPRADINGDCQVNIFDFLALQGIFTAGCD